MGKYETDVMDTNGVRNSALQNIANELAEANRLKRLEFKHGVYLLHTKEKLEPHNQIIKEEMEKELEDQA